MLRSLFIGLIPATLLIALSCHTVRAQPGGPPEETPVVISPVVQRDVAEGRTFVGTVHASQTSVVGTAVDGRVEQVLVDDGDWVTALQPLAQLRIKTIDLEVRAARAELHLRMHELAELKAGSRPEEKARARAALEQARALFEYADSRLARTAALPEAASSQEELEQDRSARDAAEQALREAEASWKLVEEGPRQEQILQAEAQVRMQALQVLRLKDQQEKYTIYAPFDGYVVTEHAEVGQWLSRADPVMEMVAVDPIEIRVYVPEAHIAALGPGMKATVQLDALPERLFEAVISRIVPQADLRSRSFPVRIELENPREERGHVIKPGMLAHVTLAVGRPRLALLVPKDALVLGGATPVVYVVRADRQTQAAVAVPVSVSLGVADEQYIQVNGELQAGENVVVEGNERLRPGAKVRAVPRPNR
jgi:RND family efflux transporter MFP subunit